MADSPASQDRLEHGRHILTCAETIAEGSVRIPDDPADSRGLAVRALD